MKKHFFGMGLLMAATLACSVSNQAVFAAKAASCVEIDCKSAYLMDFESGTEVFAQEATKRLPIASMCKVMTLLLSFEAVESGALAYDEQIVISENASGMGGSQVFLQENLSYSAEELMKTVTVCSANDSCVALAERICGSESAFVEKMNERARELGAENTLFANCTGLPREPQYSCAKDVAVMLRELLTHEKYFEFSRVWLEDFAHPDGRTTRITNTNKLIRFYEGCDGGKTGFTQQAGFCLAATAKRGNMRLISVVIGADTSAKRFASAKNLLNYAFGGYESKIVVAQEKHIEQTAAIRGGKTKEVQVVAERNLTVFGKKGEQAEYSVEYQINEGLKAPISRGDIVGEAILFQNGVEIARCNLLSAADVARSSWWDNFKDLAQQAI